MRKRVKSKKTVRNPLDNNFSAKRGRGRPVKVAPTTVRGRADNLRERLERLWNDNDLGARLVAAHTEQEVVNAIRNTLPGVSDGDELLQLAPLILKVVTDSAFPKRQKAQIHFLADSIGGFGCVTPRRSRDICAKQRKADAQRHQILRYEYWIECSCGHKGRSEDHACRKCGALIRSSPFAALNPF